MARVTVEDCVVLVPNRFELVSLASQRARDIASGAALTINRDNDKDSVVALREIAEGTISPDSMREAVIKGHQKAIDNDTIDQIEKDTSEFVNPAQIAEEMKSLVVNDALKEDDDLAEGKDQSFAEDNLDVDD